MTEPEEQLSIGVFSHVTQLTKKALHLYEQRGLLLPARKEITGYRSYSFHQIPEALRLKRLADLGFGLSDMREIMDALEGETDGSRMDEIILKKATAMEEEISRLQNVRESLENRSFLEVVNMDSDEAKVKDVPSTRVVSKRATGSYQNVIPKLMGELFGQIMDPRNQQAGARPAGPPIFICHDSEPKEDDADIEVALPVGGKVTVPDGFEVKSLDACQVVYTIHKGAYNQVGEAYKRAFEYLGKNRYRIAGPCREVYLNDPNEVAEEDILTEVQIPVSQ